HIVGGFRFELSKCTVQAIRQRMLSSLANVSDDLVERVADGLGMDVPEPMPRALENPAQPEIETSPALSLTARPGNGTIRTRKIALLVANGFVAESLTTLHRALLDAGAVPRYLSFRLGEVTADDGSTIEADATLENSPSVLFDAVVLAD